MTEKSEDAAMCVIPASSDEGVTPVDHSKFADKLKWLEKVNCEEMKCKAKINKANLKTFESIFKTESLNPIVYLHEFYLSLHDLAGILDNNCVNDNIITFFASLINKQFPQHRTYFLYLNHIKDYKRVAANLKKKSGDSMAGVQLIFCLNVCNANGVTHVGDVNEGGCKFTANHFTMAVYSCDRMELIYADTLGWPFPISFSRSLNTLLSHLEKKSPSKLQLAHDPQSFEKIDGGQDANFTEVKHVCSESCCKHYPTQTCSSICGIAVIIGASIAAFSRNLFYSLLNLNGHVTAPGLRYLKYISDYSDFLRLVIIDWMITGEISINKLLKICPTDQLDSSRESKSMVSKKKGQQNEFCNTSNSQSALRHCFQTSKIDHFFVTKPYLSHLKNKGVNKLRLDARLKCGTFYSRKFPCSSDGKADEEVIKRIQLFLDSPECLKELTAICASKMIATKKVDTKEKLSIIDKYLVGPPQISYVSTKRCVRMRCILKSGQTKCKQFKCSEDEEDQARAKQEVMDFMQNPDFANWLLGYVDSSLAPDPEWRAIGKVPVGTPTTDFFKQLTFPYLKHFDINNNIVNVERQNCEPIPQSDNVKRISHHLDDVYTKKDNSSNKNQYAAWIWITCASKSGVCHSKCGLELSTSTLISAPNDHFLCPSCGVLLQGENTCSICGSTNSQQWMKLEDRPACKMCYQYAKRGELRSDCFRRNSKRKSRSLRFYHSHLKCNWKLKLILMSNDLSMWNVFVHRDNKSYHPNDDVYLAQFKTDLSSEICLANSDSDSNFNHEPEELQTEDCIMTDVEANKVPTSLSDRGLDSKVAKSLSGRGLHSKASKHFSSDNKLSGHKKMKILKPAAAQTDIESDLFTDGNDLPVACGLCIQIGKGVFTCSNQEQLFDHVNSTHLYDIMTCNLCYRQGLFSSFATEEKLADHMKMCHNTML